MRDGAGSGTHECAAGRGFLGQDDRIFQDEQDWVLVALLCPARGGRRTEYSPLRFAPPPLGGGGSCAGRALVVAGTPVKAEGAWGPGENGELEGRAGQAGREARGHGVRWRSRSLAPSGALEKGPLRESTVLPALPARPAKRWLEREGVRGSEGRRRSLRTHAPPCRRQALRRPGPCGRTACACTPRARPWASSSFHGPAGRRRP